jgi:hypothetical protein
MTTIAIFGAAGKMGTRISTKLKDLKQYKLLCVEADKDMEAKLAQRGLTAVPAEQAAKEADVVILAVPDKFIGAVAGKIVPMVRPGTLIIGLDPAAPHNGKLPPRKDVSYFVVHPAHPPIFNDETDPEARKDYFGAGKARQAIVCALMQGPDSDYAKGEAIASAMFGPILRSHRVTVEQMALLEPALAETVAATCLSIIREGMDEIIRRGVPEAAARDFILGHMNVETAILFGFLGKEVKFSDGCLKAIEEAKKDIFQSDWKKVFDNANLMTSIQKICGDIP